MGRQSRAGEAAVLRPGSLIDSVSRISEPAAALPLVSTARLCAAPRLAPVSTDWRGGSGSAHAALDAAYRRRPSDGVAGEGKEGPSDCVLARRPAMEWTALTRNRITLVVCSYLDEDLLDFAIVDDGSVAP